MNLTLITTAAIATIIATVAGSASAQMAPATPPAATAPATGTADLTVDFTDIESPTGTVAFTLYNSEAAFDAGGAPVRQAMVTVTGTGAQAVLRGLPAGRYAIKAFHDVDGNGRMATNPFGMPTEPYAFSNNAVANMGPARWAAANFEMRPGNNSIAIVIR